MTMEKKWEATPGMFEGLWAKAWRKEGQGRGDGRVKWLKSLLCLKVRYFPSLSKRCRVRNGEGMFLFNLKNNLTCPACPPIDD